MFYVQLLNIKNHTKFWSKNVDIRNSKIKKKVIIFETYFVSLNLC